MSLINRRRIIKILPFNGEGFATWKFQVTAYLRSEGLVEAVHAPDFNHWRTALKTRAENGMVSEDLAELLHDEQDDQEIATTKLQTEYAKQASEAYTFLVLQMGEKAIKHVVAIPEGKAHAVWRALHSHFERDTMANKLQIRINMITTNLQEGEDFTSYHLGIEDCERKLLSMGDKVSESEKLAALLRGLPSSYDMIVTTLTADDQITYTKAVEKIKDYQYAHPTRSNPTERTLSAVAKEKPSWKNQRLRETRSCFYCGKTGHLKADCRRRQRDEAEDATSLATVQVRDVFGLAALEHGMPDWILDSGASRHVSNNRNDFMKLRQSPPVSIKGMSGKVVIAHFEGEVLLQTKFGKLKLEGVLYAPTMAFRLLSVSGLLGAGYQLNFGTSKAVIKQKGKTIAEAPEKASLFCVRNLTSA